MWAIAGAGLGALAPLAAPPRYEARAVARLAVAPGAAPVFPARARWLERAALDPMAALALDRERRRWRFPPTERAEGAAVSPDSLTRAAAQLAAAADVSTGAAPGLFSVRARAATPEAAVALADALAAALVTESRVNAAPPTRAAARRLHAAEHALTQNDEISAVHDAEPLDRAAEAPPPRAIAPPVGAAAAQLRAAETMFAERARIYGPRHPLYVDAERAVVAARAALARAKPLPAPAPPAAQILAEPDASPERAAALAALGVELAEAHAALETARQTERLAQEAALTPAIAAPLRPPDALWPPAGALLGLAAGVLAGRRRPARV